MKKTLLIASLIAIAMGAQAQVDEWNNPFEKWGVYNYVQKESDGEFGKWFLEGGKYPTLAEYDDSTRIKFENNQLSIVFDINNDFDFPQKGNRYLNIKFHLICETFDQFFLQVKQYKEDENPFENSFNFDHYNNSYKELFGHNKIFNQTFQVTYYSPVEEQNYDYRYVRITIGCRGIATTYLSHIEIKGTNGHFAESHVNYREYGKYQYFYEPFFFHDLEGYENNNGEDIKTDIDNNMESSIYVSNGVLHTGETANVSVFNASGILVRVEHNTNAVDISDLKKGVYIAKVNEKTIKFVK